MKTKRVNEIILPYRKDIPVIFSVTPEDRLTYAVALMVTNNLRNIAVIRNDRPVGMIRLKDALKNLGLQLPDKSK